MIRTILAASLMLPAISTAAIGAERDMTCRGEFDGAKRVIFGTDRS